MLPVMEAMKKAFANEVASGIDENKVAQFLRIGSAVGGAIALGATKNLGKKLIGELADDFVDNAFKIPDGALQSVGDLSEVAEAGMAAGFDKLAQLGKAKEKEFRLESHLVDGFRRALTEVSQSIEEDGDRVSPIIILVDELDRCRPTYAIELLERIKHLFGSPGVAFLIATDTKQLGHSIEAVYGSRFDSIRYLHRFFDDTYRLDLPSGRRLVEKEIHTHQIDEAELYVGYDEPVDRYIANFAEAFSLDARSIRRLVKILATAVNAKGFKAPLVLPFFLPLAYAIERGDSEVVELMSRNGYAEKEINSGIREWLSDKRVESTLIVWRSRQRDQEVRADLYSMLTKLRARIFTPLSRQPNEGQYHSFEGVIGWVHELLDDEFRIDFGRRASAANPPNSNILNYRDLIESAGLLLPNLQEPEG